MMVPRFLMFSAFCVLLAFKNVQADEGACQRAASEYLESEKVLIQATRHVSLMILAILEPVPDEPKFNGSVDVASLSPQLNLTAQALDNAISRCSHTPELCPNYEGIDKYSPGVLRAAANVYGNIQTAKFTQDLHASVSCWAVLLPTRRQSVEANTTAKTRMDHLVANEWNTGDENSTASCGFICGRKCACRKIQIGVPMQTEVTNAHIRDLCGQKVHDFVQRLQQLLFDAMHCSEFGDYVKDFGLFTVNYQANKADPVRHERAFVKSRA